MERRSAFEYSAGMARGDEDLGESLLKDSAGARPEEWGDYATADLTVLISPNRYGRAARARKLVSRGQQKAAGLCSMILGATDLAQTALEKPILLLLDDPAAELDKDSRWARLMGWVNGIRRCQIDGNQSLVAGRRACFTADPGHVFHVEHGSLTAA